MHLLTLHAWIRQSEVMLETLHIQLILNDLAP